MSVDDLVTAFGVGRATIDRARKKLNEKGDMLFGRAARKVAAASPALPPIEVVPPKAEDERNWLATEDSKSELQRKLGSKLGIAMDAMTPEKAARTSFKDLAIASGIMVDKLQRINEGSSAGVGMLATALLKMVGDLRRAAGQTALPAPPEEPTDVEIVMEA